MCAGVLQEKAIGHPHRIRQHGRMEVMLAVSEKDMAWL